MYPGKGCKRPLTSNKTPIPAQKRRATLKKKSQPENEIVNIVRLAGKESSMADGEVHDPKIPRVGSRYRTTGKSPRISLGCVRSRVKKLMTVSLSSNTNLAYESALVSFATFRSEYKLKKVFCQSQLSIVWYILLVVLKKVIPQPQ